MRGLWLSLLMALPMAACGQVSDPQTPQSAPVPPVSAQSSEILDDKFNQVAQAVQQSKNQAVPQAQTEIVQSPDFGCTGVIQQGGAVLCQTFPNQKVKVGRSAKDFYFETADETGRILIGFDRDEKRALIDLGDGNPLEYNFDAREYDVSHVTGLPPSQVGNYTEKQLAHIRASSARKKEGFASRSGVMGFENGFIYPVQDYRKTTNFGAFRSYNGKPGSPHMGVDMAAPTGTPIYAPADGVVSMADNDLYFEGAMVLLDHGQGFISMYLHVNEVLVEPGQVVKQGEQIATIGSRGRSTGPHLCWRLKWRNRALDPELLTNWPAE